MVMWLLLWGWPRWCQERVRKPKGCAPSASLARLPIRQAHLRPVQPPRGQYLWSTEPVWRYTHASDEEDHFKLIVPTEQALLTVCASLVDEERGDLGLQLYCHSETSKRVAQHLLLIV